MAVLLAIDYQIGDRNRRLFGCALKEALERCVLTKGDCRAENYAEEHGDSTAVDCADNSKARKEKREGESGLFYLYCRGAGEHADNGAHKLDESVTESAGGNSTLSSCIGSVSCVLKICVHGNTSVSVPDIRFGKI